MVREYRSERGVPVLHDALEGSYSGAVGIWVRVGSRDEAEHEHGISHLVEHMLFKGTASRSAADIAASLESVGGEINAFTSREYTCFYVRAPAEHLEESVEVLFDLIGHATFESRAFQQERRVVLEEIRGYEGSKESLAMDLLASTAFGVELGHPITGSKSSVRRLQRDQTYSYYRQRYRAESLYVTLVGKAPLTRVLQLVDGLPEPEPGAADGSHAAFGEPVRHGVGILRRDLDQTHLCIGWEGLPADDPDRPALNLLHRYLGGGMSSRLFQALREKRGLAYQLYTFHQSYRRAGIFGLYCATEASQLGAVVTGVTDEIRRFLARECTEEWIVRMRRQLRGSLMMSMERPSFRMTRMGASYLYAGRVPTVEESLAEIEAITVEDVRRVARRLELEKPRVLTAVGKVEKGALRGLARAA